MENNINPADKKLIQKALKKPQAPFVLPRSEAARAIQINKNDFFILAAFAERQNVPYTTMLHNIIGSYADCKLNDYAGKIKDSQDLVGLFALECAWTPPICHTS